MGAHRALLELMNVRVVKTVRNDVNRRVNCEAANLNKIISASVKEIEDIRYIFETKGMDYLPENLREIAKIRLENPESSLKEIGQMLEPPLGKSGVNHRLKKISTIVEELRGKDN
jgi:DNA-binding protein WhiA